MSLRVTTTGESHGPCLTCVVEGLPAGLSIDRDELDHELKRRQHGHGRGARMKIEDDRVDVIAGLRHGFTLGSPLTLRIENKDFANWAQRMDPWYQHKGYKSVTCPRPGHADLVGVQKYGFSDVRNVLERASARETAARVAGGAVVKQLLRTVLGIEIRSHVTQIGRISLTDRDRSLELDDFEKVDLSLVRCIDESLSSEMVHEIDSLRKSNESIGGCFEVLAFNVAPGLGSYVSWEQRLDGRIGQAMMSIQSVKGCAIGDGFSLAGTPGSAAHDEIFVADDGSFVRHTNRAGGIEGGVTNGQPVRVSCAAKPLATLTKPLRSVDISDGTAALATRERTDSCVIPAAAVVGEAMLAIVLSQAAREKFGGDHIDDMCAAVESYRERISSVSP